MDQLYPNRPVAFSTWKNSLNTVSMGLNLLQREIESTKTFETAEEVEQPKAALGHSGGARSKQEHTVSDENIEDWLDLTRMILKNTYSSVDVLNDILNYDKILSGKLSLELNPISIWKVVQITAAEFVLPSMQKNISFHVQHQTKEDTNRNNTSPVPVTDVLNDFQDFKVVGDAVRLTQVLRNLISNALKFTPESGKIKPRMGLQKPVILSLNIFSFSFLLLRRHCCYRNVLASTCRLIVEETISTGQRHECFLN